MSPVTVEEPEFTKVLENVTVREYAALDLKVRAQGVPKPEIQWFVNFDNVNLNFIMLVNTVNIKILVIVTAYSGF